ncbi:MAG TPA: hypothetical protein VFX85_03080 [Solirubrobacterales bacterium]|nr:hypothetical protein [Solirubrobacterales bacterium]
MISTGEAGAAFLRGAASLVLACVLIAAGAATTAAAPADLAYDFGDEGIAVVEGAGGKRFAEDAAARMAVGPEDEVFVLFSDYDCTWQWQCPTHLTLARFDAAGARDRSFDVELTLAQGPERMPFDVAVGPDGKPVIAAYDVSGDGGGGLRVFRFDRDGRPDPGFGGDGEAAPAIRPGHSAPVAAAVQPDGKVVVSTEGSRVEAGQELRVARYSADGTLDSGFGTGGVASIALPTQTRPADLLLGPGGTVVVGSPYCCVGGSALFGEGFSLARLLGNGQPDLGFAGSGGVRFPTPGAEGLVEAMALAPDGGILVLFEERTETVSTVDNLTRFNPDGSLDGGFGQDGRLRTYFRVGPVMPGAIAVDGRGRIVGTGFDPQVRSSRLAAFRLLPDGNVDRTFNGGQRVTMPVNARVTGMGLQSGGRIVALARSGGNDFFLAAFSGGDSHVRCQQQKATIVGTARADELVGTKNRDVIAALGGKDKVRGLSGADVICGGPGQDTLLGGPGNDEIRQ